MKKGTCKRFMAMAMSLVTALGTGFGGGVNMVYAANSFKAGDTVQIKYLHNNKTYKKSAVDARWNDKILGTKMPGYIDEDSNAMYSAYWIFGQAEGPKVLYKNSGDTFTLSRYNTTIKMTVDSKTAYINGKKTTMSTAPRKVYNYGNKTNYIMVPGSWTAKNLGISYKWNATKRAGCMRAASQSGGSNNATTATTKPTTTAVKPTTTTAKPTETKPEVVNKKVTTSYDMTASAYAKEQSKAVPKYNNQTFDENAYQKKITSTVNDEQYMRIDVYHNVNESAFAKKLDETICNDPQVCRIVDLPVYYELETNNGNRDYRIQIGGHYMNYNTVYVGMDVHKESFTLCSCKYEDEKASHYQRTPASYKNVLRYLAFLRTIYGEDTRFVCGYEAGCLGYSLYHQLENFNVECVILAPTTMLEQRSKRRIKTDKRDAEIIARSLAQHNYSPVHIPTETDNQTKEFIRMRDDHKAELKKIKQQILAFCLRQGYQYDGSGNWTAKHVKWLRSLKTEGLYKEILDEYLLTYTILTDKLNRLDQRIEELASKEEYKESVSKLTCFLGIKIHTALSVIVEVGDFQRFVSARKFAGYLGLVPGQHSSGDDRNGLGITKAGNTHVRRLLVESAQSYTRGKIGYKSRVLRSRQAGNSPQIINYADRANERLRRRYYQMVLKDGKKYNIAKIAVARELACFIWGMMTDNIY